MSDTFKSPLCKDRKYGTCMSAKSRVNKRLSILMMPEAPERLLPSPFALLFYQYTATMFKFTSDLLVNATASKASVHTYHRMVLNQTPLPK